MVLEDDELASPWRAFMYYTALCLGVWSSAHSVSLAVLQNLLDIQSRIYMSHDGTHHPYNPHHVMPSADSFVANFIGVLSRLQVYEYDVPGKVDADTGRPSLVPFDCLAAKEVLARNLRSPRAVASMIADPRGHIMSRSSCEVKVSWTFTLPLYQASEPVALCRYVFSGAIAGSLQIWVANLFI